MVDAAAFFEPIARDALCSMDPQIGRWLRGSWGEDDDNKVMNALPLKELVRKLLPECCSLLVNHHSAGVDALLHRRLAHALYGLGRAHCRLAAGAHEKQNAAGEGEGDVMECALCKERF